MSVQAFPSRFSSRQPIAEGYGPSYLWPARSQRGTLLAISMVVAIAALDLWGDQYVRNNYSVLYVVPLILLAHSGGLRFLWQWAGLMIALTYGVHFLKNFLFPLEIGDPAYFDFRLINRTFSALVILAVSKLLQLWVRWRDDENDAELSDVVRAQDQEVASTLAVLCFAPLIAVIAIIDCLLPAHINLAILYPIPLFVAGWTRSRALLWSMVTALLLLTVLAFVSGSVSHVPNLYFGLERQRLLAVFAMLAVAINLHVWIGPKQGE